VKIRQPVELPLWGNLIVAIVVGFLLGVIIHDIIQACRYRK
jgi:hypothetical protein